MTNNLEQLNLIELYLKGEKEMNNNENNNGAFNLGEILRDQGRKKRWLAKEMATTEATIGRWCSGGRIPKIKIEKIKQLLGVEE